ncbi:hypothetical protein [uncultured Tateyamaria sp.]|uniref:hypothetical protein n=1 Tax=uncultured Tateyamaria sp. TaxID=455651 RepID=UPI00260F07D9|nr:hypothetical protein [uncultured Tateyamaria sp.]
MTVSYGTFSCTLEGFDDSFGTMKAIAEYFRDLASDDRYFGAEPPQPDVEMLARIAEREISRRVEAREQEGRIVLSAGDAAAPAAAAVTAAAPALMAEPAPAPIETPAADDLVTEDAVISEPVAEPEVDATPAAEDQATAMADVEDEAPVQGDALVEAHDEVIAEAAEDEAADIEAVAEELPEEAAAFFAGAETDADAGDAEADVTSDDDLVAEAADAAPQNSIAAKLQRIRAVVSQSQDDEDESPLFEDEHAEDFAPHSDIVDVADAEDDAQEHTGSDVIEDAARAIEASQDMDEAEQAAPEEDGDDDIAAILARFDTDASDTVAETEAPMPAAETAEAPAPAEDDDLGLDTLAALLAADDGQQEDGDEGDNLFEDSPSAEQDEADPVVEEEAAEAPRRARVIKVKRADIDAAIASGQLEEVEDASEDDAEGTLSDEQEAELMAELAGVEAELEKDAVIETADASVDEIASAEDDANADVAPEINDDDVSRLMAEADNQMEEPEGSSRRNAFAHLKAAVMAKKADAGIGAESQEDEGAFRSDLASVVQPRRPAARGTRAERPEGKRPAPLKLVAEQRVDVDASPKGPVRPRRVAAVEEAPQPSADAASFADYASDMGAHDLPALLEAAASYLSFVEGRDQFSRPQLMTKVRQVEQGDFSREDGLRSFGQLLRAGKIEKIKGGRFAVTGDIGYRPDQRAAG